MKKALAAIICLGVLSLLPSVAQATECGQFYLGGQAPKMAVPIEMNKEICYSQYAIGYHYNTKSALYAAQTLTKRNVLAARQLDRLDNFHDDPNIPSPYRVDEADYRGSMMDRGHLAPNKDFSDPQAQYESFSMANMVPQLHAHNAGIWLGIETAVRNMAVKHGKIQVVTGGVYTDSTRKIRNNIPVPSALYKAVYIDNGKQAPFAAAYVSKNDSSGSYQVVSINKLTTMIGMDVFPSANASVKAAAGDVFKPSKSAYAKGNSGSHEVFNTLSDMGTQYIKKSLYKHFN